MGDDVLPEAAPIVLPTLWLNQTTGDTGRGLNPPPGDGWVRLVPEAPSPRSEPVARRWSAEQDGLTVRLFLNGTMRQPMYFSTLDSARSFAAQVNTPSVDVTRLAKLAAQWRAIAQTSLPGDDRALVRCARELDEAVAAVRVEAPTIETHRETHWVVVGKDHFCTSAHYDSETGSGRDRAIAAKAKQEEDWPTLGPYEVFERTTVVTDRQVEAPETPIGMRTCPNCNAIHDNKPGEWCPACIAPVPPETPQAETTCGRCTGSGRAPSPTGMPQIGAPSCLVCGGSGVRP